MAQGIVAGVADCAVNRVPPPQIELADNRQLFDLSGLIKAGLANLKHLSLAGCKLETVEQLQPMVGSASHLPPTDSRHTF